MRPQDAEAPETIDGIRVKRSGKRAKGGAGAPARPRVEKTVVNCLACGKVYDCRPVTNDIIMFLGEHALRCTDVAVFRAGRARLPITLPDRLSAPRCVSILIVRSFEASASVTEVSEGLRHACASQSPAASAPSAAPRWR